MSIRRLIVLSAVFLLGTGICLCQSVDPSLLKLSNIAFGWAGASGLQGTMECFTGFAPPMITLRDCGYHTGGEGYFTTYDFNGFTVHADSEAALATLGAGVLRLVHYGYNSNSAEVPAAPGLLTDISGDALEVSYAQRVGNTTIGISAIPQDASSLRLSDGTTALVTGRTKSELGGRVGFMTDVTRTVRVGANYSSQNDTSTVNLLTEEGWVSLADAYTTHGFTYAASWHALPNTWIYASNQRITSRSSSQEISFDTRLIGVKQDLTKAISVQCADMSGAQNIHLNWLTRYGLWQAGYIRKVIPSAQPYLGRGNAWYVGATLAL